MNHQLPLLILLVSILSGCDSKSDVEQSQTISEETSSEAVEQQASEIANALLVDGTYTDDDIHFQYPQYSQKRIISTEFGPIFVVYFQGGGGINFTFLKQDFSGEELTLQEFTDVNRQEFGTQFENPEELTAGDSNIDGHPAFERTWQGKRIDNGVAFSTWQSWAVVDESAYMFGAAGPADQLDAYRIKVQQIMDSVKFTAKDN